ASLDAPETDRGLAFSPDGRFLSSIQGADLWLQNHDTRVIAQVTHRGVAVKSAIPGSAYTHPDAEFTLAKWSPDSRSVAQRGDDRRRVGGSRPGANDRSAGRHRSAEQQLRVHDAMREDYVATFTLRKLVEHFDRYLGRGPTSRAN